MIIFLTIVSVVSLALVSAILVWVRLNVVNSRSWSVTGFGRSIRINEPAEFLEYLQLGSTVDDSEVYMNFHGSSSNGTRLTCHEVSRSVRAFKPLGLILKGKATFAVSNSLKKEPPGSFFLFVLDNQKRSKPLVLEFLNHIYS